ncbi:MAG TPA: hypothetical protein VMM12_17340 [Longimicrobiales bacterium]|nr:hypothetical protein [Longimicrobiales bacterium]
MRALAVTVCLTACAPVAQPPVLVPPGESSRDRVSGDSTLSLPPAGYGSLRQDEFSVEIVDGPLHVKVTPLAEEVIRLAAPDTYDRLRALAGSRQHEAETQAGSGGTVLFLVSFFSQEQNVEYRPDEIQISHRGRIQRASAIVPLTTGWGRQLLQPQQTQSAIYAFEPPFDYQLPLTVRYGLLQSDDWNQMVLPRLEEERTRVISRAGGWAGRQR